MQILWFRDLHFFLFYCTNKLPHAVLQLEIHKVAMISVALFFIKFKIAYVGVKVDNCIFDRKNAVFVRRFNEGDETFDDLAVSGIDELIGQSDAVIGEGEGAENTLKTVAIICLCNVGRENAVFVFCSDSRVFLAEFLQLAVNYRHAVAAR